VYRKLTTEKSHHVTAAVSAVATASLAKKTAVSSLSRGHRAPNWRLIAAFALGSILLAGTGLVLLSAKSLDGLATVRPTETIRIETAKPTLDSIDVLPHQGTINRMNAISKSFSKQ
jgi:hypothetical protein